jgi:ferredoxin-NADP reductase/MOSC domain-containing protein YiiM
MATLLSVNVGMPKDVSWRDRTVHTGVWKSPVDGPRMVRRLNIDGDGQGDLAGHGGEQRAVLVYQVESYRHWEEFLRRDDLERGAFGENFTVEGLADDEVCIGDSFRIGEAEFEVTQPRVTCFRVGMRMGEPRLPSLLVAHHRPGFYLRVLTEGHVSAGDEIVRTARGAHSLTVAEVDALLYLPGHDRERLRAALDVPALSPGWQGSFRSMLEGAEPQPAGVAPAAPPAWAGFRTLTVADVVAESDTVTSFRMRGDEALPAYLPGQFLTLRVPGAGDPVPVRTYSLSGDPTGGYYRISVKRESLGLVSAYLHRHLRQGDRVEVAAPRGDFVLTEGTRPVLLVSAGIGVTPLLAMLHRLADEAGPREVWWIHTTHDARTHALADEASDLLGRLPEAHSLVYYTAPDRPPAQDSGIRVGRLTADVVADLRLPTDATAYVCGPESFMSDVTAALAAAGLDPREIHTERFGSRSAINPGVVPTGAAAAPHQPPGPLGTGPAVTFARTGLATTWSDRYGSILELAEACDVPTQWSCRTGVCHTCVTAVLSGQASYDVAPLEDPGRDELLICSATPTSDLVVDL